MGILLSVNKMTSKIWVQVDENQFSFLKYFNALTLIKAPDKLWIPKEDYGGKKKISALKSI